LSSPPDADVRFLVDNNLSSILTLGLEDAGHDVLHVRDVALGTADDSTVLTFARDEQRTLVSADTDFGTILAQTGLGGPSVVLFRRESGRRPAEQSRLLLANLDQLSDAIEDGSVVVLTNCIVRIRKLLPIP
jgi:predicted nuclease of predicted toxin-antitoxin system